jgi:hypothetical protein
VSRSTSSRTGIDVRLRRTRRIIQNMRSSQIAQMSRDTKRHNELIHLGGIQGAGLS